MLQFWFKSLIIKSYLIFHAISPFHIFLLHLNSKLDEFYFTRKQSMMHNKS